LGIRLSDMSQLREALIQEKIVEIGDFTLKSGEKSRIYVDFRKLVSKPVLLKQICEHLGYLMDIEEISSEVVLVGVLLGGVPISMTLSVLYDIPALIVRDHTKTHGTQKQIEGDIAPGEREVILIEDVITTGSSVIKTLDVLEAAGYTVSKIVTLLDREAGGVEKLKASGYDVRSLFCLTDFKRCLGILMYKMELDYPRLKAVLDETHAVRPILQIISGENTFIRRWAQNNDVKYICFPTEWKEYPEDADDRRNLRIANSSTEVLVIGKNWKKSKNSSGWCNEHPPVLWDCALVEKSLKITVVDP